MDRLRYDDSHWAREGDSAKALQQYLELGERPYNRTKQSLVTSLLGDVTGRSILDYGGGAGIMAVPLALAGGEVTLVDAEANSLATARHYADREGVASRLKTVEALEVPDDLKGRAFDVVVAKDIVEHITDDEGFLADLASCQERGGILVLSTQSSFSLNYLIEGSYNKYRAGNPDWLGWDPTHVRFYTPSSLAAKLRRAGYEPERWASVFIVPYNILYWASLGKLRVELPVLRYVDLTLGRLFPFNRMGWNIIVRARRSAD